MSHKLTDGGHVMHAVIFSRHPMLDVGFRIVAALLLPAFIACRFPGKSQTAKTPPVPNPTAAAAATVPAPPRWLPAAGWSPVLRSPGPAAPGRR